MAVDDASIVAGDTSSSCVLMSHLQVAVNDRNRCRFCEVREYYEATMVFSIEGLILGHMLTEWFQPHSEKVVGLIPGVGPFFFEFKGSLYTFFSRVLLLPPPTIQIVYKHVW